MVVGDMEMHTDLLVIGGGPGGYGAAFRAADLGLDVILVDSQWGLGGLCLHAGCIPAKALLHAAEIIDDAERAQKMGLDFGPPRIDLAALRTWQQQKIDTMAESLMTLAQKRGILVLRSKARFAGSSAVRLTGAEISAVRFKHAVIATGSRARGLPGVDLTSGGRIMDAGAALALTEIPRTLVVANTGYIGLELASIYAALGSKVTILEQADRLLPGVDADLVVPLQVSLTDRFSEIILGAKIEEVVGDAGGVDVRFNLSGTTEQRRADRVLLALGRIPNSDDLGLDHTGVTLNSRGFIETDETGRTHDPKIFAVGDVAGGPMLAHKAIREGRIAAETICGKISSFDVRAMPVVVYTNPQLAWCGLTEQQARQANIPHAVKKFPWQLSDRAQTLDETGGLTKLVIDPDSGRLLGAGMVGRHAEGLIAETALAIEMGALAEDLALTLHPYPTLSETESEAAELFLGNPTRTLPESQ